MKILRNLKNRKWTIHKSTGIPHNTYLAVKACTTTLKEIFPVSCEFVIVFCKDENLEWAYEEDDFFRIGKYLVDNAKKDKQFIKKFYDQWHGYYGDYLRITKKIDTTDLSKLDNDELLRYYEEFDDVYCHEYSTSMLCDHFGFYTEKVLSNKLNQEKFITLTTPAILSFVAEEELDLLNVVEKNGSIEEHTKKYNWIANTYTYPTILTKEYFIEKINSWKKEGVNINKKIKELENYPKEIKENKKRYISKLDDDTKLLVELIDTFAEIHDKRKRANLMASYYSYLFLKELNKRSDLSMEELKFIMPYEAPDILKNKFDKEILKKRMASWAVYRINEEERFLYGKEADKVHDIIFSEKIEGNKIKGITASAGKAKGKVKIVYQSTEVSKMENGDILVASMTRPDYMPAIRKAAAIVTDEGGITCHAAIVSRELKIPCIIATEIATKVLKDDQLVEVDADNGVVRIIN